MEWNKEYDINKQLWGEGPSELGIAAVKYLQKHQLGAGDSEILDIGCGYGRDSFYLLDNIRCKIVGIDASEKAIEIAKRASSGKHTGNVQFHCMDFHDLGPDQFNIVFMSNLYQLLKRREREELRDTVMRVLRPNGLLFLSTLSVSDPEHAGKGIPVADEPNSLIVDEKFLHFCTRDELMSDFSFLKIKELYEHEYYEPRATGETHHHISWILMKE